MAPKTYTGVMVTDGNGNLYGHPAGVDIETDDDGNITNLERVRYDGERDAYIVIGADEPSHNEVHHVGQLKEVSGTSGPLYDGDGNLVYPGDPHHFEPTPDDPHYDADAPNKTKTGVVADNPSAHQGRTIKSVVNGHWVEDTEYGDPTLTAHTEAYRGKK